jgi:hypothetical protein
VQQTIVALKLPGNLFEDLEDALAEHLELGPPVMVAGGAEAAHAPNSVKKTVGALLIVTALLKTSTAGVQLAAAIKDYVDRTGESVQIIEPQTGGLIKEVTDQIPAKDILDALKQAGVAAIHGVG